MQENGKTLFTKRISGGSKRHYFIDVRESEKTGARYLLLSESRLFEGSWKSYRLLVFSDHAQELKEGLDEAFQQLALNKV